MVPESVVLNGGTGSSLSPGPRSHCQGPFRFRMLSRTICGLRGHSRFLFVHDVRRVPAQLAPQQAHSVCTSGAASICGMQGDGSSKTHKQCAPGVVVRVRAAFVDAAVPRREELHLPRQHRRLRRYDGASKRQRQARQDSQHCGADARYAPCVCNACESPSPAEEKAPCERHQACAGHLCRQQPPQRHHYRVFCSGGCVPLGQINGPQLVDRTTIKAAISVRSTA